MIIEKIRGIYKKHPIATILITTIVLLIVVPLVIQKIYHTPAPCKLLEEKIPPGNLLAYVGTVLTFVATFSLSLNVYNSNEEERKRSRLLEAKTLLSIDKSQEIKITYIDVIKDKPKDIFWNVSLDVLSEGTIEKVFQKNISIDDYVIKRDKQNYWREYREENRLSFQYISDKNISMLFALSDQENKAFDLMKGSNNFSISGDFEFICDTVKTPITITIILKETDKVIDDEPFVKVYEIEDAFISHRKAKFC